MFLGCAASASPASSLVVGFCVGHGLAWPLDYAWMAAMHEIIAAVSF